MKHRNRPPEQEDLLRRRLVDLIDMRHELVKLAALIDWEFFDQEWAGFFPSTRLCWTNAVRDSSCESSVIAGGHEQTEHTDLQDPELARIQQGAQV